MKEKREVTLVVIGGKEAKTSGEPPFLAITITCKKKSNCRKKRHENLAQTLSFAYSVNLDSKHILTAFQRWQQ